MAIQQGYKANFETLQRAFMHDDVCLLECTRRWTGEPVVLICAVQRSGDEFAFIPFAEMCSENPYEAYIPPQEMGA